MKSPVILLKTALIGLALAPGLAQAQQEGKHYSSTFNMLRRGCFIALMSEHSRFSHCLRTRLSEF
jgi:hypothetical protein